MKSMHLKKDPIELYKRLRNQNISLNQFNNMQERYSSHNLAVQIEHLETISRNELKNDEIITGLKLYVEHLCDRAPAHLENIRLQQFGLSAEVKQFLDSKDKNILLIQGNIGSGKVYFKKA